MIGEPVPYILSAGNLKYLASMVMHSSRDSHYYISLLFRIKNSGIHYILCERLKYMSIRSEIPQLIEIMVNGSEDSPISHPVYKLMWFKAKRCLSFRIDLFLRLKSVLSTIDESKASHCYFLCCDILDIDRCEQRRNLKTLSNRFRFVRKLKSRCRQKSSTYFRSKYYLATRTLSVQFRCRTPTLQGLMLFFAKAVTSTFNSPLFSDLDTFSRVFNTKKNFRSLQIGPGKTVFRSNIRFLETLANISDRMKRMSSQLRSRALAVELEILNHELCSGIINPFDSHTRIVNFLLDHAKALDSAENCPYVVLVECAYRSPKTKNRNSIKLKKAKALRNQLESLNDLGDIGDVDGIRESLLNAMEAILFGGLRTAEHGQCASGMTRGVELETKSMIDLNEVARCSSKPVVDAEVYSSDADRPGYPWMGEAGLFTSVPDAPEPQLQVYFDDMDKGESLAQERLSLGDASSSISQRTGKHDASSSINFEEVLECQHSIDNRNACPGFLESCDHVYGCDDPEALQIIKENDSSSARIKRKVAATSRFAGLPGWGLKSFIVKSGGIIKHEYIAYQVLTQIKEIFMAERLPIYIRNYKIILISDTSGLVETVQDAISIHRIKADGKFGSLSQYFVENFEEENLLRAKKNFLHSLVGYSLASYLLQIKDRHNGNIMIDSFGHIIHVDFGFVFGKYPGILYLESAPFKFSAEYLELIDLEQFKSIFVQGFKVLRKHREKLTRLMEIMEDTGYCDKFTLSAFLDRLRIGDSERDIETHCHGLIAKSIKHMGTMFYDQIQYLSNGYL